jgi:hypothetical protein
VMVQQMTSQLAQLEIIALLAIAQRGRYRKNAQRLGGGNAELAWRRFREPVPSPEAGSPTRSYYGLARLLPVAAAFDSALPDVLK